MSHTYLVFESLLAAGFGQQQSAAIAHQLGIAFAGNREYARDDIADALFGSGFTEAQAEKLADLIGHCYWSQRFNANYNPTRLKTELVREGIPNADAEALLGALDMFVVTPRNNDVRKAVKHGPGGGQVFMCDFRFLRKPEMQKERRAVVLSPKSVNDHHRCVVVPVSMTPPADQAIHHCFTPGSYPFFHRTNPVWAICDHLYTVSLERLWYVTMNRKPVTTKLTAEDFNEVRSKVAKALQLESLSSTLTNAT